MIDKKLPKAIFFDWDGTLVDSLPFLLSAHNHVLQHFGKNLWHKEEAKEKMRLSTREMYPSIFGDDADQAMKMLYTYVENNHLQHLTLLEGVVPFLDYIHAMNIPMGIVSNRRDAILKKEIGALAWSTYFPVVIGAGVAAQDKPAPDPLLQAIMLSQLAGNETDIWFVGDTETDMRCAHAAGCKPVFIGHGMDNYEDVEKLNPYLGFGGFHDFTKHLEFIQKSL